MAAGVEKGKNVYSFNSEFVFPSFSQTKFLSLYCLTLASSLRLFIEIAMLAL